MNLGYVALDSGDYGLARASFESALQSSPGDVDAKLGLAVAMRGEQDYDSAARIYDEVVAASPEIERAYINGAILHSRYPTSGSGDSAHPDFNRALKMCQEFIDNNQVSPSHRIHGIISEIGVEKEKWEAKERERKERERLEKERIERNKKLLEGLATQLADIRSTTQANASCLGEEVVMEMDMYVTQGEEIVGSGDADMAPDVKSLIDDFVKPTLDEYIATLCAAGGGGDVAPEGGGEAPEDGGAEPAPEEDGEPAPEEGGE